MTVDDVREQARCLTSAHLDQLAKVWRGDRLASDTVKNAARDKAWLEASPEQLALAWEVARLVGEGAEVGDSTSKCGAAAGVAWEVVVGLCASSLTDQERMILTQPWVDLFRDKAEGCLDRGEKA